MNRFSDIFFQGVDAILTGIFLPLILGAFASLVQIALFGWQGVKKYCANFCTSVFMGVLTHWLLLDYEMPGQIKAAIVSSAALISSDALKLLVSKRFIDIIVALLGERLKAVAARWLGLPPNLAQPSQGAGGANLRRRATDRQDAPANGPNAAGGADDSANAN